MKPADLSLVDTSDGLQVLLDGRPLYDKSPAAAATRKANALPIQSQTLYLLTSPAAWHGVAEFQMRLPPDSAILAIEGDQVLLELSRRLMPDALTKAGIKLSSADGTSIKAALGAAGVAGYRRVKEISFCRGASLNRPLYRRIRQQIEDDIRTSWQNRITLSSMGRLWISNVLRNLPMVASGTGFPRVEGPVVVCGAGPSLNTALPLVASLREMVTLLAVDTALPSLASHNIAPDYVIAIEGQLANVYDFLPVSNRSYTLLADITSSPTVVELHDPGRVAWLSSQFAELPFLERLTTAALPLLPIPPLGSVGVSAVEVARRLSCGPILLTGLDFSFRPGHDELSLSGTHAPGSPFHLRTLLADHRLTTRAPADLAGAWMSREGSDGGPVKTTLTMVGYAEQMNKVLQDDSGPGTPEKREIVAIAPFGLDTGARAVSPEEAAGLIRQWKPADAAAGADPTIKARAQAMAGNGDLTDLIDRFLAEELRLLERLRKEVEETISGKGEGEQLAAAFAPCTYVAVEFPDFTGSITRDRPFLTRLRVTIDFYSDRISRALRSLRS